MDEKTKHTPGPWKWNKDQSGYYDELKSSSTDIVNMEWGVDQDGFGIINGIIIPNIADANLIAAAPDLLFAARQALMSLEEGYDAPKIRDDLRDAIAKAEGRDV